MSPKIQAVRKHNCLLFRHWATRQFAAQRYLLETTSPWRKPQLMWAGPCPPCPDLAPSRGKQSHLCVTQLSVWVSFGAFWFSCGSDTYLLFYGLSLSLCFSPKRKKKEKVTSELSRAGLLQRYVVCLMPLQGCREETEDRSGSDAVRTMSPLEKNNSDVIHLHVVDLVRMSWWSCQCVSVSWNK